MNAEWDMALKMFCNISKYQGFKVIGYSQVEKYDSDFFSQKNWKIQLTVILKKMIVDISDVGF